MLGARMLGLFMKYTELVILTYYSQADIIAPVYPTSLIVNSSPGVPYYTLARSSRVIMSNETGQFHIALNL